MILNQLIFRGVNILMIMLKKYCVSDFSLYRFG